MSQPKNMMRAKFREEAKVIYTDNKNNKFKAEVVDYERVGDMDFFSYTIKLTDKKVDTGDPSGPTWEEYEDVKSGVSDYSMELL